MEMAHAKIRMKSTVNSLLMLLLLLLLLLLLVLFSILWIFPASEDKTHIT